MKTNKKLDRSLAVLALAVLAAGHGFFGGMFALIGSAVATAFTIFPESIASPSLATYLLPVIGYLGLGLCVLLLIAAGRVGRPGSARFVLGTLAVTALVDSPLLLSMIAGFVSEPSKAAFGPIVFFVGSFVAVAHTVWTHERARRAPAVAA